MPVFIKFSCFQFLKTRRRRPLSFPDTPVDRDPRGWPKSYLQTASQNIKSIFLKVFGNPKPFANFAAGEFAPSLRGGFKKGFWPPEARSPHAPHMPPVHSLPHEKIPPAGAGGIEMEVWYDITRRASSFSQVCRTWRRQKPQPWRTEPRHARGWKQPDERNGSRT